MMLGEKRRIGNFIVAKKRDGKIECIEVSNVVGNWSIRYRADNIMFRVFNEIENNDVESVHILLSTMLSVCHILDGEFTKDVAEAINAYMERNSKHNDRDYEKIVEEEKRVYEMNKEMKDLEESDK